MPEATIRLVVNPQSGKRDVIVTYTSDEDATPLEHEDEHRQLVDRLIEGGALRAAELGQVIVQRGQKETIVDDRNRATNQPEREAIEVDR